MRSHLRLVVQVASRYRGYGLPSDDLIGEGNVGLMRAVCRFDPDRGVGFATYALWWICAAMHEFILHNWSLVRMGTTCAQTKLFFNLRRMCSHLQKYDEGRLNPEDVYAIAKALGVRPDEVICMNDRMAGSDYSLNVATGPRGQTEWQSLPVDDVDDQETVLAERGGDRTPHSNAASYVERADPA